MRITETFDKNVAVVTYQEDIDECARYIQELYPVFSLVDCRHLMHMLMISNPEIFETEEMKKLFERKTITCSVKIDTIDPSIKNYIDRIATARSFARKKVSQTKSTIKNDRLSILKQCLGSLMSTLIGNIDNAI